MWKSKYLQMKARERRRGSSLRCKHNNNNNNNNDHGRQLLDKSPSFTRAKVPTCVVNSHKILNVPHAILVMEIMDTRDLSRPSPSQRTQIEASGCEDHNCLRILSTDSGDRRSSTIPSLVGEPRTFSQFKL